MQLQKLWESYMPIKMLSFTIIVLPFLGNS